MTYHARDAMKGFTLLEAMVALSLLGLGVAGLIALQLRSLEHDRQAFQATVALFMVNGMLERLRANPGPVYQLDFEASRPTPARDCQAVNCSAEALRAWDLWHWQQGIRNSPYLPDGQGAVRYHAGHREYTVTLRYQSSPLAESAATRPWQRLSLHMRAPR